MKLTIDTSKIADTPTKGIVYLLDIELEGSSIVKIGMTNRAKVEHRVVEILTAMWQKYRYFPKCYVARYKKFDDPLAIEKKLHNHFKDNKIELEHSFGGSTEFFNINIDKAKDVYDRLYKEQNN